MLTMDQLTRAEAEVLSAYKQGVEADLAGVADATIRAELLRACLLGVFDDTPGTSRPNCGLQISGAQISGVLDLTGAAGPGGGALPGLALIACDIDGLIRLNDCRLFSLSISRSRFRGVEGRGLWLEGSLDFSAVRPFEGDTAHINVRSGRIGGNIYGQRARLRGLREDPDDELYQKEYRYALRLTECSVGGSIYLTHGVYADGGVVVRNTSVAGNVWADGAEALAADAYAFSVQGSSIGGGLRLGLGFKTTGCVSARHTHVHGSVRFDGADLRASAEPGARAAEEGKLTATGVERAIDFERLILGGDLSLGEPDDDAELSPHRTRIEGDLSFAGCTVGGDVSWSNLELASSDGAPVLFNLAAARIERRLRAHSLDDTTPATIRLRAAAVGMLQDTWPSHLDLKPWGSTSLRLQLDGFTYQLPSSRDVGDLREAPRALQRFRHVRSPLGYPMVLLQLIAAYVADIVNGISSVTLRYRPGPARRRLNWLKRIYPRNRFGARKIKRDTFRSQPYAQAARALAAVGLDADARQLQLKQLRLIRRTGRVLRVPDRWLYDVLFGYGTSPWKAIRTLLAAFLIGWFGVWRANTGGMLELQIQPTLETTTAQIERALPDGAARTDSSLDVTVACGGEINNALYALDVFIPLVDLRQDSECEIPARPIPPEQLVDPTDPDGRVTIVRIWEPLQSLGAPAELSFERELKPVRLGPFTIPFHQPDFWRFARALYALSGWILLSLAILTFTGVLQRRV